MITENLSTLKIHKLTQEQYDRELEAGNIDDSALYLTPDEDIDFPVDSVNGKTGEVTLTASDVDALPTSGGTMSGTLNMGSNNITYLADPTGAMQATNKRYVDNALSEKANSSHEHAAGDITSGTLGVARGGTGRATLTANAIIAGNATSAVKQIATASGALYATAEDGAAKFGVLPIPQGGTGATTAAKALTALGAASATPSITSTSTNFHYIHLAKIGNLVICTILPKVTNTDNLISSLTTGTGIIPAAYRPAAQKKITFFSENAKNAGDSTGSASITVNTTGSMVFESTYQATVTEFSKTIFWTTA